MLETVFLDEPFRKKYNRKRRNKSMTRKKGNQKVFRILKHF